VLFVVSTNNTRSMSSGVASVDVSGDVVHVPGEEDYWQISWKVLLALEWALGAADFDYVLKTDDDSYVCVPGLLRWLTAHGSTELLYGGSPLMQRCAARQDLPLLGTFSLARSPATWLRRRSLRGRRCLRRLSTREMVTGAAAVPART
jgi:hypothetical protein